MTTLNELFKVLVRQNTRLHLRTKNVFFVFLFSYENTTEGGINEKCSS